MLLIFIITVKPVWIKSWIKQPCVCNPNFKFNLSIWNWTSLFKTKIGVFDLDIFHCIFVIYKLCMFFNCFAVKINNTLWLNKKLCILFWVFLDPLYLNSIQEYVVFPVSSSLMANLNYKEAAAPRLPCDNVIT